jgi:hypothetical protein
VNAKPDIIPDGLPDHLPDGEILLWQGRPDWKQLANNAFHVRKVAIYFMLIIIVQAIARLSQGQSLGDALGNAPYLLLMAAAACGILAVLAFASAKTTLYTITSKRLLLKVGVALPAYVNIPLKHIEAANFADTGRGCGMICFRLSGPVRLAYLLLWPHVRPWHFAKPQPALRDIPMAEDVAAKVAAALGGLRTVLNTGEGMSSTETPYRNLVAAE